MDVAKQVTAQAKRAAAAARALGASSREQRDAALGAMAEGLRREQASILAANAEDVRQAREDGTSEALIDRLALSPERIEDMAAALEALRDLDDPVGRVLEDRTLYNGLSLRRVSVPLGVVAVIYEARPNVTADAAGICIKAGNACLLRGGSMAARSNQEITRVLAESAEDAGLPADAVQAVSVQDRAATDALLSLRGLVDAVVPRGGAGLIEHCVSTARVPVIETGTGLCHVYLHESADPSKAAAIVENAKCRRYGVCNAAETLLVDASAMERMLPPVLQALGEHGVLIHGDEAVRALVESLVSSSDPDTRTWAQGLSVTPATQADWETEYLAPEISIRCVSGAEEAMDHIRLYGTKHSEAIVAEDADAVAAFQAGVDAAVIYANASTAFTDGGQFGLGAEIGISTQKLHVRGPFATDALTTYKYLIEGDGQVRS